MIVIDGRQSNIQIGNFANLEEILVKVMEDEAMNERVVTDVLLNDENFSEIYPHQAEDIESGEIQRLEVRSVPADAFAADVTVEMFKVVRIMQNGANQVAALFRQANDSEALEVIQDLIEVTRDFLGMVAVLRDRYAKQGLNDFNHFTMKLTEIMSEMNETMENEDWVLLADLLEFEYNPVCDGWSKILENLAGDISNATRS